MSAREHGMCEPTDRTEPTVEPEPGEELWDELSDALDPALALLGLSRCAECLALVPLGDDLCDSAECRARADEVGQEVGQ